MQASLKASVGKDSGSLMPSGKANPCPVCGRQKDGDCRIGAELVLCHHGSSHHPPKGLNPGDTRPGGDGQQWAYTKDTSDGRAAIYVIHKPLQAVAAPTNPPTKGAESFWRYSATFYVCRFPNKRIRPLTWVDGAWRWKGPDGKRPMLLSHPLAAKPDATVLIVEGEKTWDAAQKLFPGLVACCWSGGCKAIEKTNFTPLAGRKVVLWPDNDDAGRNAMQQLAQVLYGVGAASVKVVGSPNDAPQGWDIADADWTASDAAAWVKANTSAVAKTSAPGGVTPAAAPGSGNAVRLKPNQILKLLPDCVGTLRLNIRSGDVHTDTGIMNANDAGHLYLKLSSNSATWGKEVTADAVAYLANQNQFDPVADFLNDTGNELPMEQWQRLDQHLLGINDPIAAEFLPRYLIGAVARVFKPGCDVRQTPVLVGPQWRGKTALGRILFGAEHWISGVGDLGKDALMRLHTAWGVELAELDGVTRRSDQESLKAFLTETCDSIRRPYDVATVRHPRKFVFWGTSNGAALRDTTGNTRYVTIPIPDQMLPLEWAQRHRNALWARAVEQYKADVDWNQCSEAIRNAIADRNDNFTELDPWHDRIAQVLKRKSLELQLPVQVGELLQAVEVPIDRQKGIDGQRVRRIAESLGWVMERRQSGAERRRGLWPAVPQVPQAVPQGCHKAKASDGNRFGTAAISATRKPKELDEKREQQHPEQQHPEQQQCPLDTVGAKLVALMAETPNPSDANGSDLVAGDDHLVARLVAPVSPQTISGRQAIEQRIRELGHSADLSGWSDEELPDLLQSLEAAHTRRAAAAGIAIPDAA